MLTNSLLFKLRRAASISEVATLCKSLFFTLLLATISPFVIYAMSETMLDQLSGQKFVNMVALGAIQAAKPAIVGFLGAIILVLSFVLLTYVQMLRQRATLPPGPFPWPIVGNTLQLSKSKPWLQFKAWSRANGNSLLTIWIGRTPTVICNDAWTASELMEKRSFNYSSRPRYIVFGELTGQSTTNQVLLPYNDQWRLQRKIMVTNASKPPAFGPSLTDL